MFRVHSKNVAALTLGWLLYLAGQRSCVGEHLTKMKLFLFITHLMHRFTFEQPEDSPPITIKGTNGITNIPQPYEIKVTDRR